MPAGQEFENSKPHRIYVAYADPQSKLHLGLSLVQMTFQLPFCNQRHCKQSLFIPPEFF